MPKSKLAELLKQTKCSTKINMENAIKTLQSYLRVNDLDAFLVTNPANIFYLTGINNFDSEKGFLLIITRKDYCLVTSRFYQNRIGKQMAEGNIHYVERGESVSEHVARIIKKSKHIGFEREDLSYCRYEIFKKALKGSKLVSCSNAIENLRTIKTPEEIALIKKAAAITDKTFGEIWKLAKPGLTELFLKRKILEIMQDSGAQGCSFDPIVASGRNSADPHYEGSNKQIKAGEMVVIDIGARYKNYDADLTRMLFMGKATARYKKMYAMVLEVQEKALAECKLGASVAGVFNAAVERFKASGEDRFFTHGLGHGVGIDIHELPSLSAAGQGTFENGMVFTVEPGLYHSNFGGIRIEDLCLLENNRCKRLSKSPKHLIEIG